MPVYNTRDGYHKPKDLDYHIEVNELHWDAIGEEDPLTRLLACVAIGGAYHHLEAREVKDSDTGHVFVDYHDDYEHLVALAGDAPEATVTIEGREYMLYMTPYC